MALPLHFAALLVWATAASGVRENKFPGDWKDLPKNLGWGVFDAQTRPFNPAGNLVFCKKSVINIPWRAGVEDYSTEINAAFQKLRNSGGGTVKLAAGKYVIRKQIYMFSFSCFQGAGMKKTTLFVGDNAPTFDKAGTIRSLHTKRVSVLDMTIDGNMARQLAKVKGDLKKGQVGYGRYGFFTELTNWVYLRGVSVENHFGYGFDPHGSKKEWAYFLLLEDCEAHNNGLDGFTLDQTVYVGMRRCLGTGNHRHGTNVVTGTRYCRVEDNVMRGNGFKSGVGCNIMAQNNQNYGTRHLAFVRNSLTNARKSSFCFNDVHHVGVERNTMGNVFNKAYCYHMVGATNVFLRSSSCKPPRESVRFRVLNGTVYSSIKPGLGQTKSNIARALTAVTV